MRYAKCKGILTRRSGEVGGFNGQVGSMFCNVRFKGQCEKYGKTLKMIPKVKEREPIGTKRVHKVSQRLSKMHQIINDFSETPLGEFLT